VPLSSYEYYTWIVQPLSCAAVRGHAILIKQALAGARAACRSGSDNRA
jgi:hypothetical protein